jgi:hypothetical protein
VAKVFAEIDDQLRDWIARQSLFFVGTAPRGDDGHVNVSTEGADRERFACSTPTTVAYLDLIGSGAETIAHLRENGRIVVMLCAFEGPPRILRLHGRGEVVMAGGSSLSTSSARAAAFEQPAVAEARRAIVVVDVTRVADSCGYGVPLMSYEGRRPHQDAWAEKKVRVGGTESLLDYQREKERRQPRRAPGGSSCPVAVDGNEDHRGNARRRASGAQRASLRRTPSGHSERRRAVDIRSEAERARDGIVPGSTYVARNCARVEALPQSASRDPALARAGALVM